MDLTFRDPGVLDDPVEKVMGPRLPTVGIGQPLELAVELLERAPAVVVLAGGRPHVVLSRTDVLRFLSSRRMSDGEPGFETRAIHAGAEPDPATGAVVPPISLATTFAQRAVGEHTASSTAAAATRPGPRWSVPRLARGRGARLRVRQRAGGRGRGPAPGARPAATSCSATTPTAARSG